MKYTYIAICVIILLLVGCAPEAQESQIEGVEAESQSEIQEEEQVEEPEEVIEEEQQQETEEEPIEQTEPEAQEPRVEEPKEEEIKQPETEKAVLIGDKQIQQIFGYAKTKINSYTYKYKNPAGRQYKIYVKGNKIRIDDISDDNKIYLDKEKKTAEEWCISHTKCGRQTGKIADLDYYNTYIETPIDWLSKITEAEKIDEGFYYGKQGWRLNTDIGTVTIDSNFGFIYNIKQEDKTYLFTEAQFNRVKDSDVNVPEYLLPD